MVSELVTNAVPDGRGAVVASRRGLRIVESLTDWGVVRDPGGTAVWVVLAAS